MRLKDPSPPDIENIPHCHLLHNLGSGSGIWVWDLGLGSGSGIWIWDLDLGLRSGSGIWIWVWDLGLGSGSGLQISDPRDLRCFAPADARARFLVNFGAPDAKKSNFRPWNLNLGAGPVNPESSHSSSGLATFAFGSAVLDLRSWIWGLRKRASGYARARFLSVLDRQNTR